MLSHTKKHVGFPVFLFVLQNKSEKTLKTIYASNYKKNEMKKAFIIEPIR